MGKNDFNNAPIRGFTWENNMGMNSTELRAELEKMGVKVCGSADQFYGREGDHNNLWVSLEQGALADYENTLSDAFLHSKINKAIEKAGFFIEDYDSGTAMIWAN